MPAHVIFHERRHEIVAVIIASLAMKGQRDPRLQTCALQQVGAKLFAQELIGVTIIDKKVGKPCTILDQRNRIILAPCFRVVAEIAAERLDAPRYL